MKVIFLVLSLVAFVCSWNVFRLPTAFLVLFLIAGCATAPTAPYTIPTSVVAPGEPGWDDYCKQSSERLGCAK